MLSRTILTAALLAGPALADDAAPDWEARRLFMHRTFEQTRKLLVAEDSRLKGLTPEQLRQVADPNNPQFEPPRQFQPPPSTLPQVEDGDTPYFFPDTPDDATKAWALKRAFQLNGNSMVGGPRMIDVSGETPFANPVQIERIAVPMPAPAPSPEERLAKMTPVIPAHDVCSRHGMHRVTRGNSWRCK